MEDKVEGGRGNCKPTLVMRDMIEVSLSHAQSTFIRIGIALQALDLVERELPRCFQQPEDGLAGQCFVGHGDGNSDAAIS